MVIKMSTADDRKKVVRVWEKYSKAPERSRLVLLENNMN